MTRQTSRFSTAAVVVAVALLFGCSDSATEAPAPDPTPDPAPEQSESPDDGVLRFSYTVRGKVVTVPSAERPFDDLSIHHEAVPDFRGRDGEITENSKGMKGMMSMTMGFPVAAGVSLEGIAPGDIIEFTFVFTWGEPSSSYELTEIKKLPSDTELNFGG